MEEVRKENENVSKKIDFEFEMSYICIAKHKNDDISLFRDFLHNIFHINENEINEYIGSFTEDADINSVLVGPYARDLAKSLVYRTTCYLNTTKINNSYVVYIKED